MAESERRVAAMDKINQQKAELLYGVIVTAISTAMMWRKLTVRG